MTLSGVLHIVLYFAVIAMLTKPVGAYMAAVFEGNGRMSTRVFAPVERAVYRVLLVDAEKEMDWKRYAISVLVFSTLSMFATYAILRAQGDLPLNPQGMPPVSAQLS